METQAIIIVKHKSLPGTHLVTSVSSIVVNGVLPIFFHSMCTWNLMACGCICRDTYVCICVSNYVYRERDAHSHILYVCHSQKCKNENKVEEQNYEIGHWMSALQLGLLVSATFQVPTPKRQVGERKRVSLWSPKRFQRIQMKLHLIIFIF